MAKRKSSNRRLSRFNRSSIRSGFLDPNSEVLGEEEPFWWNNLTNNANQSLVKNNIANQTSKYLDSDTQTELTDASNGWWNVLDSTDSEVSNNLPKLQTDQLPDAVPRIAKAIISDSDEEDSRLQPQKRKITIRGKSKRSKSNPFLKALVDSETSKSSKSIQDTTVSKPTNDASINNEFSKESDFIEDNVNATVSTDHSYTTGKILRSKPQVFRKRYKGKRDNVFEDLLNSAENKPNETEVNEMVAINSSDKLIEGNKVSEENVSNVLEENDPNVSKERTWKINSSIKNVSKQPITNPEISRNDGNHIYYERSDSSFEIQFDHMEEASQKEFSVTENRRNQTISSTHSLKEVNNSHVNGKIIKSPEKNNKNDELLKRVSHVRTLNNSNISQSSTHSRINNSKRLYNITEQENVNEEDGLRKSNIESVISQSLPVNKTLTNPLNIPLFKHKKSDLEIDNSNIGVSFKDRNNTINNSICNVTKNFANESLTSDSKINDSRKQMNATNSPSKTMVTKDVIEYKSNNNEQLEAEISTASPKRMSTYATANLHEENLSEDNNKTESKISDMRASASKQKSKRTVSRQSETLTEFQTDKLDKKSISKDNDETQPEELNMGASTSKQKSKEITNIFTNNNDQNVHKIEQLHNKTKNTTNLDRQKRINEYFPPSSFKLNTEMNEDEEIKKILKQKKQKLDLYLDKIQVPIQLNKKEMRERIKILKNEGMKKQSIKAEIHRAYLVNGKRYKRPKLPRPKPWVTDRFYRYLWKVMEPKYKLLTRVESEKFVQRLSNSVSIIVKSKKYEDYKKELDDLLNNMARLGIIHTRNDFYDFSYEFLPYDFRVKVVPMIMPGNVRNIPYNPEKLHEPLLVE